MTNQEIQERITKIDSELASIQLKSYAVSLAGGIASVFFLAKDKKFLGKVGYFFLGDIVAGISMTFIVSTKVTELIAEKENLSRQLQLNQ